MDKMNLGLSGALFVTIHPDCDDCEHGIPDL